MRYGRATAINDVIAKLIFRLPTGNSSKKTTPNALGLQGTKLWKCEYECLCLVVLDEHQNVLRLEFVVSALTCGPESDMKEAKNDESMIINTIAKGWNVVRRFDDGKLLKNV